MAILSKVQHNVEYINTMREKGVETLMRSELPYPNNIKGIKQKAPVLAIEGNRIYLTTLGGM